MQTAEILVLLLASISAFALLAQRFTIPYPILLVLGGLVISFIPGLPAVKMDPDLVLLIFLPPLLYGAGWVTPWMEFRQESRAIFLLAVGCVLFTAAAVAFTVHWLLGMPLSVGFVIGSIVSTPDAVAASAIAQRLGLPRRVVVILEGESLVNDATGLVAYKFAIAAVLTGAFSFAQASLQFVWVACGGVAIGWVVGWITMLIFERVKENSVLITLSLLVPYVSYLSAERLHVSGVLAAVTTGIYLGWRAPRMLSSSTRLEADAFWNMLVFLLNSIIFLLIGLQLSVIWEDLASYSIVRLVEGALAVSLAVIVVRVLWVFPGAYLPWHLSRRIREREPKPPWRQVSVVAWSGMRGVVSLAAALALPLATTGGEPFPYRNLVIFLSFAVILATLVGQGLTLPILIKWLGVKSEGLDEKHEIKVRLQLAEAAQLRLGQLGQEMIFPEQSISALRGQYDELIVRLSQQEELFGRWGERREDAAATLRLRKEALKAERRKLVELHHRNEIDHELLHKIEHELDLDEAKLKHEEHNLHARPGKGVTA